MPFNLSVRRLIGKKNSGTASLIRGLTSRSHHALLLRSVRLRLGRTTQNRLPATGASSMAHL